MLRFLTQSAPRSPNFDGIEIDEKSIGNYLFGEIATAHKWQRALRVEALGAPDLLLVQVAFITARSN